MYGARLEGNAFTGGPLQNAAIEDLFVTRRYGSICMRSLVNVAQIPERGLHSFLRAIEEGDDASVDPFWDALYAGGADLILNGHDHDYERFALQTPDQVRSPDGLREFVVGTGGVGHGYFQPTPELNSVVRNVKTYGVLQLTLHPDTYDWRFLPVAGKRWSDSGTGNCHN
jgi:hypothetical protein